jgi:hypothetical protein
MTFLPALFALLPAAHDDGIRRLTPELDNTLYQTNDGSLSNGAGERLFAGVTAAGFSRRALLRFDLSAVPEGARITKVSLRLQVSKVPLFPPPATLAMHRLSASWGEGASDAFGEEGTGTASLPGDATWLHRSFPTDLWATPGGDFITTASAKAIPGSGLGPLVWSSYGLVEDVQAWVDGTAPNYGWLIKATQEGVPKTAKRFDSREFQGSATALPLLELEYEPGTHPCGTSLVCQGNGADLGVDTCSCGAASVTLTMTGAPPGQTTYLLVGRGSSLITAPSGDLCLGGAPIGRYALDVGQTDAQGTYSTDVFNAITGGGGGALPDGSGFLCPPSGQTFGFQYWHRQPGGSAFSKGLRVSFE